MKTTLPIIAVLTLTCLATTPARAQTTRESAPPATAPARRTAPVPQGFIKTSIEGADFICDESDVPWIRDALAGFQQTNRPTTMPADIAARLTASRDALKKRIAADLALSDEKSIDLFFDQTLLPQMQKFTDLHPPLFYLVFTRETLVKAARAGWEYPPTYTYNRAVGDVMRDPRPVRWSLDAMDDVLLPVRYEPTDSPAVRRELLLSVIRNTRTDVETLLSGGAQLAVRQQFVRLINEQAINPLKLRADQQWFGTGVASFLGIRYASEITGGNPEQLIAQVTDEKLIYEQLRRRIPTPHMLSAQIDLLHPTDFSVLRPEMRYAYFEATGRKSLRAISHWIEQGGTRSIPRTLEAFRKSPPSDGNGLVQLIRQASGVDVTPDLIAK